MLKTTGTIIKEIEKNNNTWLYDIRASDGNINRYISFGKQFLMHYKITVTYVLKKSKPPCAGSKVINKIQYHDHIKNVDDIKNFLRQKLNITPNGINKLLNEFGKDTISVLTLDFDKIRSINLAAKDRGQLEFFHANDTHSQYQKIFTEMDVEYKKNIMTPYTYIMGWT